MNEFKLIKLPVDLHKAPELRTIKHRNMSDLLASIHAELDGYMERVNTLATLALADRDRSRLGIVMVVDEDGVQKCKSVNFRASKFYGGTHDYIYGDVLFMAESWGPDGIDFVTLPDYFTLEYFIAKLG